jgi:hypothetical protein
MGELTSEQCILGIWGPGFDRLALLEYLGAGSAKLG